MGGGLSRAAPECSCKAKQGDLPYDVYDAARTGLPGPVVEYLQTTNRDVNAQYRMETMLHVACANGRENILTILLNERSLCLNLRNAYNETALMLAARNGYRDCVEIMLVHNHRCPLQIFAKNTGKQTAIDLAHINNRQDVAFCLMSYTKNQAPETGGKAGFPPRDGAWGYDGPPETTKPSAAAEANIDSID